ncbi:carboxylesterase 5A [Condylostylus longicornis]|uniref:carboxylesterase 5A n=1 Tax=Condylostylus longicornis TaxID=2530218 RepID=UPI00244DA1B2|nr:carboxylesterase 5A [Condylostylus longicornis]
MKFFTCHIFIINYGFLFCFCAPANNERQTVRVKRIVGGRQAAKPPPDDPVVFSQMYDRDARVEGFRHEETGIYNFLGIRYADPPVGENRFLRPRFRRLEGDINATRYGPPCPQPDPYNPNKVIGNEDCLILNIYTPQMPDETTGLPVYVWIHPGGFRQGSAAQYDAQPLAQNGMIFVPVQYRLGTLGIVGDGSKEFGGNLAMLDMTVALRWVTDYISFFGGDPKQMKVIGHGSGAASAMYMGVSRLPRSGDLTGIVSMSGSALSQYATDEEPVQTVEEIAELNECPTSNNIEILKCLRSRSVEDIIKADSQVETERLHGRAMVKGIAGSSAFQPHVEVPDDDRALPGFLTIKAESIIKNGEFSKVPLLIGTAKHETANGIAIATLSKIYGSLDKFLGSMMDSINKLKSFLAIDKITGEILKPVLPGLEGISIDLNSYLKVPTSLSPAEIFQKLTETTTDVLFNLPAVLSAENWSKVAPAYLYSFDFKGNVSKGINFLRGLPIVSGDQQTNYTGHGDELGYLFETNDIYGNPIANAKLTEEKDLKVRINFISVLKQFSKMNSETETDSKSLFQRFTGKGAPFLEISDSLTFSNNFRFCELSIYGAPLQALQSTTCSGLNTILGGLHNATGTLKNLGSSITNPLGVGGSGFNLEKPHPSKRPAGLGGILG